MSTTVTPSASPVPSGNAGRVARFLATRVGLSLITLWLLSVIVFAGGQLLPGDIGRAVLGPLADARAVAALNHQLGADRPLMTQYVEWISHFVRGDMGLSYAYREPVAPFIADALVIELSISRPERAACGRPCTRDAGSIAPSASPVCRRPWCRSSSRRSC